MRTAPFLLAVALTSGWGAPTVRAQPATAPPAAPQSAAPANVFSELQALSGDWEADLPGYGKILGTIRSISNGTAIEETIGTAADNEASIYTRDGDRILMTHYCAMTPDGHQVRLETGPLQQVPDRLEFILVGSTNLHTAKAPHMRLMSMTVVDRDHFSERWTKSEAGKDTTFEMSFTRR